MKQRMHESTKLVIGMQTCHGLVTLTLRLDVAESSKVGPVSSTFDVDCRTKIYVDKWSMEMATKLNNMNGRSVESFHYVYRARQTRSNFSLPKPRIIS